MEGKTTNGTPFSKNVCFFGMGVEKGCHHLWCAKDVLCREHVLVFNKAQQSHERGASCINKNFAEVVGCVSDFHKGVVLVGMFCCMFGFGWLVACFLCLCFCVFCGFGGFVVVFLSFWCYRKSTKIRLFQIVWLLGVGFVFSFGFRSLGWGGALWGPTSPKPSLVLFVVCWVFLVLGVFLVFLGRFRIKSKGHLTWP